MARELLVRAVLDTAAYARGTAKTVGLNRELDSSFKTLSVNAQRSADAQVAAAVKRSEALRTNAVQVAAAAQRVPAGPARDAALVAATSAQEKYNRSIGVTTVQSERFSHASKIAEKDLGKATRGLLSGATAGLGFGRSLAFASAGFLAFSGVSRLIRSSITGAEDLEKAQRALTVAIQKTGGNVARLGPQYAATAKRAQEFGIDQADALTGLARATLLTGDAAKAQRAYQEALVISKATGKDFNTILTATSKGQAGIVTSLRRYLPLVSTGMTGTQQFTAIMARFGGQARANTTESERFNATLANSEATIGKALLPTVNRYLTELGAWLDKMNKSGRLQKDVNGVMHAGSDIFHTLGTVIGGVDKVTGSFKNTLEAIFAIKVASTIGGWIGALEQLAVKWGVVRTAALEAEGAEAGAAGSALARGVAGRGGVVAAGRFASRGAAIEAAAPFAPFAAVVAIASQSPVQGPKSLKIQGYTSEGTPIAQGSDGKFYAVGARGYRQVSTAQAKSSLASITAVSGAPVITTQLENFPRTGSIVPRALQAPLAPGALQSPQVRTPATGPFGAARPIPVFKNFQETVDEQLAQAQAALTKGTSDDVAAAKALVARIKRLIDQGHLAGNSLVQALQAEASALGTIWSAEDAAAQQRAQRAQAARARIVAQIQNAIDPLRLEVALSRAEAFGKPVLPRLRALLKAAEDGLRKAIAAHNLDLEKQALDQITSLKQQIQAAKTAPTSTFQLSPRLSLALARDQALGIDPTKDLLRAKAAILKFIRTHQKNIAALTDAYNQLAQINQQLGSSVQSALGAFKQASTRALTAGLGLTEDQRKKLRARLSQLGPGGTVPGSGVGAAGFIIDPRTGQPVQPRRPRVTGTEPSRTGQPARQPRAPVLNANVDLDLHVDIDGKHVEARVTRLQQKRRHRNPTQRRGPHAGPLGV